MSEDGDADMERLRVAVESLGEHFDSVQIFVTRANEADREEDKGTINANLGGGNWFARYGQVRAWLVKCDERTREEVRGEAE